MQGYHKSVLLEEVLNYVVNLDKGWFLDCTLGDGGHSIEVLKRGGRVIGLDVDPKAIERTRLRFEAESIDKSRYRLIRGNFRNLKNLILEQTETVEYKIENILFDLGVSSLQLDSPERGFSFAHAGPLDMRMDPDIKINALDLIKKLKKGELYELFVRLGEEKRAKRLTDTVVFSSGVIKQTTDLAGIIEKEVGRGGKIHPATKIFQALRIAVNDELNALIEGLDQAVEVLHRGGRVLVISFHSLEDRVVKRTFEAWEEEGIGFILTKKPLIPSQLEIKDNYRSRSAKIRVFEKKL